MARGRIVVVGSCNMDLCIVSERLPEPGETILGGDFHTSPGGKGANQAVAAARAGSAVDFVGCLGEDMFGNELIANLRKERVSVDFTVRERKIRTGVALIMVDSKGENMISVAPGANAALTTAVIERARLRTRDADFCLVQMEISPDAVRHAVDMAYRENTRVMLNAAPAPSEPLREEILRQVEVLVVNTGEAETLSGVQITDDTAADEAARTLQRLGARNVVITMGSKGSLVCGDECVFVPAREVEVVDTVGAGDAFCGGLVTLLAEGETLVESARFATAAAALACTKIGAQASLPARTDIESLWRT